MPVPTIGVLTWPHTHGPSDVTGLAEQIRDVIGTALVAGSNVTITVNDGADTITIASTGGGGGSTWGAITGTLSDQTDLQAALTALRIPVGGLFVSISATDPATSLGYGTWAAFGAGRVLVGLDSGDTDFDTVEETGGSKTV